MVFTTRTIGIISALVIATGIIGAAYLFSGPHALFLSSANAASTDALLKAYAAKDTDSDGLPDWEESLYGTDPNNAHSVSSTVNDGQAIAQGLVKPKFKTTVPTPNTSSDATIPGAVSKSGTLTDSFAQEFFANYMNGAGTTQPTEADMASFVQDAVSELMAKQTLPNTLDPSKVILSTSGSAALSTYAARFSEIVSDNNPPFNKTELEYFTDAVQNNNLAVLPQVKAISNGYSAVAKSLAKTAVPPEAAAAHAEVTNAFGHFAQATADMATYDTDPLRAMLGLAEYRQAGTEILQGLSDMSAAFRSDSLTPVAQDPGYYLYDLSVQGARNAAAAKSKAP